MLAPSIHLLWTIVGAATPRRNVREDVYPDGEVRYRTAALYAREPRTAVQARRTGTSTGTVALLATGTNRCSYSYEYCRRSIERSNQEERSKSNPPALWARLSSPVSLIGAAKAAFPQGLDVLVWGAARVGGQATLHYLLATAGGSSWTPSKDDDEGGGGGGGCTSLWMASSRLGHEGARERASRVRRGRGRSADRRWSHFALRCCK